MKLYQIDAFTDQPFKGNPAVVCLHDGSLTEQRMQEIAREVNQSESSFLEKKDGYYHLRWFTPQEEETLCGHATLAAAHALWENGDLKFDEEAIFETRSGRLTASREGKKIVLNFPAEPTLQVLNPEELTDKLGIPVLWAGVNRLDTLVEIESPDLLREWVPTEALVYSLGTRCLVVTCKSDGKPYDFLSRVYAHSVGTLEDPVTGSAHCFLAPYWKERLGKSNFFAYQATDRGGELDIEVVEDRILLKGEAVTVMDMELRV